MTGRVISTKLKNTATVLVERVAMHPLYKKTFIRSKKYLVETNQDIKEGDIVEFIKCRPISKRKTWKIIKVLGRSLTEIAGEKLKQQAEEVISKVMPEEKVELSDKQQELSNKKVKKITSSKKGESKLNS